LFAKRRTQLRGAAGALGAALSLGLASAQLPANPADHSHSAIDVKTLFATTCSFCHEDGGRAAGRGPQLMGTTRSDEFIRERIKNGKEGAMPAFGEMLSDADIDAVIDYIRGLKPEGQE
jgi:mono/diheme cytochrome c family protein